MNTAAIHQPAPAIALRVPVPAGAPPLRFIPPQAAHPSIPNPVPPKTLMLWQGWGVGVGLAMPQPAAPHGSKP